MSLELSATRIIAPFFGTSTITWAAIISTILIAMSTGYFLAQKITHLKNQNRIILQILVSSALSIIFLNIFKNNILHYLLSAQINQHIGTICASMCLFYIPTCLLSIIPICIYRVEKQENTKLISQLYIAGSIGALIGIWSTVFILIPNLSSQKTLYALAFMLLTNCLLYTKQFKQSLLVICISLLCFYQSYKSTKMNYIDLDTLYNRVLIFDDPKTETKVLQLGNHINSAKSNTKDTLVYPYNQFIADNILDHKHKEHLLFLGGAAMSLPNYIYKNHPNSHIQVVEIDQTLTKLAQSEFDVKLSENFQCIHQDARYFLNTSDQVYDQIVFDVFTSEKNIPDHLTTIETAKKAHQRLNKNGLLQINVLASLKDTNQYILGAIKQSFSAYFKLSIHPIQSKNNSEIVQNIILIGTKKTHIKIPENQFFSDEFCPASFL